MFKKQIKELRELVEIYRKEIIEFDRNKSKKITDLENKLTGFRQTVGDSFKMFVGDSLKDNLVKCDVCGCLLEKQDAIKGKSTVEEVSYMYGINYWVGPQRPMKPPEEIIVEHYYCKVHGKGKK